MIEQHYAGVIENWDGNRVPAEEQIRRARRASGPGMDLATKLRASQAKQNALQIS
jgi:hypothetical protein